MSFTTKQKGVLTGMLSGLFIAFFTLAYAAVMNPLHYSANLSLVDRFAVVMRMMVCLAFFLGLSIARLARHRFFTPEDIDGSGLSAGSKKAKILQAELQNTLEQVVLAMPVYFTWLTLMPPIWLSVLPVAAVLFFFGRFFFLLGYEKGAAARSFGFALTFYPTLLMLATILLMLIYHGLQLYL